MNNGNRVIGMDIGRSGIKAVTNGIRLFGLPMIAKLPTDTEWRDRGAIDRVVKRDGALCLDSLQVGYDGAEWLIGGHGEDLGLSPVHAMSVEKADTATRLLVLAALAAMEVSTVSHVCIGIPHHGFARQGPELLSLLRGEHQVTLRDGPRTFILKGLVVPEGVGLWLSAALTPDGLPEIDALQLPTAVLDFGHRTIQVAVFQGLRTAGIPYLSVHGIYEVWKAALVEAFEGRGQTVFDSPQRALTMTELLQDGLVTIRGKRVTLDEVRPRLLVHAAARWPRIKSEIDRALEGARIKRVVAGGGGATLFERQLRDTFGEMLVLLPDRFAQAEGYRALLEHHALIKQVA